MGGPRAAGRLRPVDTAAPIRVIMGPPTDEDLRPLEPGVRQVWIQKSLTRAEYQRVGEAFAGHSGLHLFLQNRDEDLSALEWFPGLESFEIASLRLRSLDGLTAVESTLESLSISDTLKTVRLEPLGRLGALRHLYLDGHAKGIEVLSGLIDLERLTLRSVTLPDLSILLPLTELWSFDLKLGGTRDVGLLSEIGRLRHVEIWRVRGLSDLDVLGSLPHLEVLHLQSLGRVERLPSLAAALSLRRLSLESMKGLTDLQPIAEAPSLEELLLVDMGQLKPEAVKCFVGHPTLRAAVLGLGSVSKNEAAAALLPLPHPSPFNAADPLA